jgi:hypothetical protein
VELLNSFASVLDSGGAGGGGAAYESIATATGTGSSSTITFSSIPSTYTHLQIRLNARSTRTGSDTKSVLALRFNNDTGSNYAFHRLYGDGVNAAASGSASATWGFAAYVSSSVALANTNGAAVIDLHDYASTTKNKTVRSFSGRNSNVTDDTDVINLLSNLWMNTSVVNRIDLIVVDGSSWSTTSTFSLYGIKGA